MYFVNGRLILDNRKEIFSDDKISSCIVYIVNIHAYTCVCGVRRVTRRLHSALTANNIF